MKPQIHSKKFSVMSVQTCVSNTPVKRGSGFVWEAPWCHLTTAPHPRSSSSVTPFTVESSCLSRKVTQRQWYDTDSFVSGFCLTIYLRSVYVAACTVVHFKNIEWVSLRKSTTFSCGWTSGWFSGWGFSEWNTMDLGVKVSADVGCRVSSANVREWSSAETERGGVSAGDPAGQPCRVLCHLPPHRARPGGPCRPPA